MFYYALVNFEDFKKIMCCILKFNDNFDDVEFVMEDLNLIIKAHPNIFNKTYTINDLKKIQNKHKFDWFTEKFKYEVFVT